MRREAGRKDLTVVGSLTEGSTREAWKKAADTGVKRKCRSLLFGATRARNGAYGC